jgi:hypothetical protein
MTDQVAWRVLFNAMPLSAAQSAVRVDGDPELVLPLLRARAVIV